MRLVYRPDHPEANENGLVELELAGPKQYSNAAPGIISDIMRPTRHMANNKMYDSKSEFRKATKAAGCVEVGNETKALLEPRKPVKLSREQRRNEIRRAISQLR